MSEPDTECERLFLSLLDRYERIFPDGIHIGKSPEERTMFARELTSYNADELNTILRKMNKITIDFTKIVDRAAQHEVRESWIYHFRDVINDFQEFYQIIDEAIKLRYH